jgi:hypothetical protein
MSFSKTISVVAALASIFAAGAAGWKLANENQSQPVDQTQVEQTQDVSAFEEKINDLEKQLEEVKEQPKPVVIQQPTVLLPPLPPVPEPKPGEIE